MISKKQFLSWGILLGIACAFTVESKTGLVVPDLNLEEQCPLDMTAPGDFAAKSTTHILSLGSQSGIDYFKATDGAMLRYAHFEPKATDKVRGVVLFLQGRGTFIEYYYQAIKELLDRGFEVWMFDLAGQGGSTRYHKEKPLHQHVDTFDTYIQHTHEFINKKIVPTLEHHPLILMGYSTGGNIVMRYLEEYPHDVAGGVLISPLTGLNSPLPVKSQGLLKGLLKGLALVKGKQGGGHDVVLDPEEKNNLYTTDPMGFEEIKVLCDQNPNLTVGGATYGWLEAALNSAAMLKNPQNLKNVIKPVLFVSAGADEIVLPAQDAPICKQIKDCTHMLLPGARHEILREAQPIRDAFWRAFDTFISEKLTSPSAS